MDAVYVVGIVAAAAVTVIVALLFRDRMVEGGVTVGRWFTGWLRNADPARRRAPDEPTRAHVFERLRMSWSTITVRGNVWTRMVRIFMFKSRISVNGRDDVPPK